MENSPNDKMVRSGDMSTKGPRPVPARRAVPVRNTEERPEAEKKNTFNFPSLGITVEADSYQEALEKIGDKMERDGD